MSVAAAFVAGAVVGRLMYRQPHTFAECLLINSREAQTDRAIDAIAQSCEELYPESAATFGSAVREYTRQDARDDNQAR